MFNSKRCEDGKKSPSPSASVAARFALLFSPFIEDFTKSRKIDFSTSTWPKKATLVGRSRNQCGGS